MLYLPPSGATDPNASFQGKNVAAGTQGSKVPRGAVENPQREIQAVIVAADLAPTNDDLTQLSKAIAKLISAAILTFKTTITGYIDKVSPKGATRASAFTANVALSDMGSANTDYVVQTLTITGATYASITGRCSIQNQNATICRLSARIRVSTFASVVYLGGQAANYTQLPFALEGNFKGLDPTAVYTIQLVTQKGDNVGPTPVYDAELVVLHDGL